MLFNAGDQVPVIPLVEVVGKADKVAPEQIDATAAKVGVVEGLITIHSWTVVPQDAILVSWAVMIISSKQRGGSLELEASFFHRNLNNKLGWLFQAGNVVTWLNHAVLPVKLAPAWVQVVPPFVLYSNAPKSSTSVPLHIYWKFTVTFVLPVVFKGVFRVNFWSDVVLQKLAFAGGKADSAQEKPQVVVAFICRYLLWGPAVAHAPWFGTAGTGKGTPPIVQVPPK